MLISPDQRFVISNLGWVDRFAIWIYDAASDREAFLPLGDARYLSLFPCSVPDQFAVLHHYDGAEIRISIHSFDNPSDPLCTIERTAGLSAVRGDPAALGRAPRYYTAYFDPGHAGNFYLLHVEPDRPEIQVEPFEWYDNSYDKDYQGIVGVTELPSGNLIISVQRDSHPIVFDPTTKQVVRKLSLADRAGNPTLRLAPRRGEIWADDYDTILKLDADSLNLKGSRRLQDASGQTMHFIGRWSLDATESLCLVPRPYSGDVLAISTDTLRTTQAARVGKQPLEAALLSDGRIIARDWQTGQLLKGSLR